MRRWFSVGFTLASILLFTLAPTAKAVSPVIKAIVLAPGSATVEAGKTQVFTLKATLDDGTTADVSEQAVWTLNGGGFTGIPGQRATFTAVSQGSWTLTTTIAGLSATAALTVIPGIPTSLNVLPTAASLTADGVLPLRIYGVDGQGNGFDVSSEVTVTTTDPQGTITAAGYTPAVAGTWLVTATLGSLTDSVPVTITPGMLKSLTVTPNTLTADPGDTAALTVNGTDAKGNALTPQASLRVTNDKVAVIDASGKLKAKSAGQTNVIVEADGLTAVVPFIVQGITVPAPSNEVIAVTKPTPTVRTPKVAAEEVERTPEVVGQQETATPAASDAEACKNLAHPWTIILIILHIILLSVYFTVLQRVKRFPWWWVPPVALTAALLGMYVGTFCQNTYLWWPWAIIGLSVIFLSVYYQNLEPPANGPPTEQPPPKM